MVKLVIKVDSRERKVIDFFDQYLVRKTGAYKDVDVSLEVVNNMKRSDYSIVLYPEEILLHSFERKTMADLAASIKNDMLHIESTLELRKETGCKISYVLEHKTVFYKPETSVPKTRMNFKQLNAKIEHIYIEHDIPTIYTQSADETAKKISNLAFIYGKLLLNDRLKVCKYKYKPYEITVGNANVLNLKIDKDINHYVKRMWCSLPGVGGETAEALMKETSLAKIIYGKFTLDDMREVEINNKKIGKRLDKTYSHLTGEPNEFHSRILQEVNGVSKAKALRIFAHNNHKTTIKQLCQSSNIKPFSDIKINGKKLGELISKRIYDYLRYQRK